MKSFLRDLFREPASIRMETARLLIRPPLLGDECIMHPGNKVAYDVLMSMLPWALPSPTDDELKTYIERIASIWSDQKEHELYWPLLIFHKKTNALMGRSGFHHNHWDIPAFETGSWLHVQYQRQGFMAEAMHAITTYALCEMRAKRLEMRCDVSNLRGRRIPERLGLKLERLIKNDGVDPDTHEIKNTLVYVISNVNTLCPVHTN